MRCTAGDIRRGSSEPAAEEGTRASPGTRPSRGAFKFPTPKLTWPRSSISEAEPRGGEHNLETLAAQPWGRVGLEQVKEQGGERRTHKGAEGKGARRWRVGEETRRRSGVGKRI